MDLKPGFCCFKKALPHACNETTRIVNIARSQYAAFEVFLNTLTTTPGVIRGDKVSCCKNLRQKYHLWLTERKKTAKCMFAAVMNHKCDAINRNHGLGIDHLTSYSQIQRLPGLMPLINQEIFYDICSIAATEIKTVIRPQSCQVANGVFQHACDPSLTSITTDLFRAQVSMYFLRHNQLRLAKRTEECQLQFICAKLGQEIKQMVVQLSEGCALTNLMGHSCTGEIQVLNVQLQPLLRELLRKNRFGSSVEKVLLELNPLQMCQGLKQILERNSSSGIQTWGQLLQLDGYSLFQTTDSELVYFDALWDTIESDNCIKS